MEKIIEETLEVVNELVKKEYTVEYYKDGNHLVFYIPNGIKDWFRTFIHIEWVEKQEDKVEFLVDVIIGAIKNTCENVLDTYRWQFKELK